MSGPSRPLSEPPAAKRERNAVETKKKLLDAAEAEFAAKGFAGARLREVAAAVGVQQALIHHYFVDKDGLYRAVLERAIAETTAGAWTIVERVKDFEELMEAFVDMLTRFYASHANLLAILRQEAASGSSVFIDVLRERTKPVFDAVEAMLRQYQKEGKIRADVEPAEMIVAALAMTIFPYQEAPLLDALWPDRPVSETSLAERKKAIVAIALRGVLIAK